ncbi:MAG: TolC family protein [Niabella sp.]|nr:TolC family protein [Niabella sp.]
MNGYIKAVLFIVLLIPIASRAQDAKTLAYYLETSTTNSPVLHDYKNQRDSLRIDSLKFRADYGIKVNGQGDALYAPVFRGWGYDAAISNGQSVDLLIRASRDFLSKKNRDTRLAGYTLSIDQLQNQSAITRLTLERAITEQYIITYGSQQQYKVVEEVLQLLNAEDIILKKLTQNAVFKQTDYLSFKVTLQQNLLSLQQHKTDWLNNYAVLNYLSGVVDTSLLKLAPPDIPDAVPQPFEQSVYAESYRTDSLKLHNEARIIHYDYRPKISAFADGGYSTTFAATPYKNFGTSAGVAVTLPIYDGHKRNMSLRQNQLSMETRTTYNEFAKKQYEQQLQQLSAQIRQYRQLTLTATEQMKYAQTLIEANMKQLPTGDVRVADFILSISNYISLKSGLVQYETALYNLNNQLHHLILQ